MWGPVTETVLEEGSNKNCTLIFQCWLKKKKGKKKRHGHVRSKSLKNFPFIKMTFSVI